MKTFVAKPLITEKSITRSSEGIYQFIVPTWATKATIADTLAKQFGVTIVNVTTSHMPAKQVFFKRHPGRQAEYKKASIRVTAGQTIDAFVLPTEPTPSTPGHPEKEPTPEVVAPTQSRVTVRSKSNKGEKKARSEGGR